eukprot:677124_1
MGNAWGYGHEAPTAKTQAGTYLVWSFCLLTCHLMDFAGSDSREVAEAFQQLINMGFDEAMSLKAAKQYKNDINQCIEYITNTQTKPNTKKVIQISVIQGII